MRTLSNNQIRMLRHIRTHRPTTEQCEAFKDITFWSLIHDGLIERRGNQMDVTGLGSDHLSQYSSQTPVLRKRAAPLCDRTRNLLNLAKFIKKEKERRGAA